MHFRLTALFISWLLLLGLQAAQAQPSPQTQREIETLLTHIHQSPCTFQRNGQSHSGSEAAKHIRDKRDYFKSDIQSTEDFIRLAATQSALTRKTYTVNCPGKPEQHSAAWLTLELQRLRKANAE